MSFTGTATVVQVSDTVLRVTGLSLGAGASGTIGLSQHTGAAVDVALPASFQPSPYVNAMGDPVSLADMLDISTKPASSLADSIPVAVVKTGSTLPAFRATFTNGFASASPSLEIYVKIHT